MPDHNLKTPPVRFSTRSSMPAYVAGHAIEVKRYYMTFLAMEPEWRGIDS
jgi:hypothetical protein